ncbi:hypothetical protein BESB_059940 [Besnoitia besnoiti]|uniref:Uncharacterized protein n=1 Tax=Besnoitia besnoiti TaxID=94643 RepID=A0A2A9MHP2_BESBE|nr:hypothetical protein BESB_059940 [Besnoitia besnoiti]PFH35107.1 hypothetical protein BESB_059940 [Besnoitia besnoiti]
MLQPHPRGTKAASQQNATAGLGSGLGSGPLGLPGATGLGSSVPFLPPPSRHHAHHHAHAAATGAGAAPSAHAAQTQPHAAAALRSSAGGSAFLATSSGSLYAGAGPRHGLYPHGASSPASGAGAGHHAPAAPAQGGPKAASAGTLHPCLELLHLQRLQRLEKSRAGVPPTQASDSAAVIVALQHLTHPPAVSEEESGYFTDVIDFLGTGVSLQSVVLLGPGEKIHPHIDFESQAAPAPVDCDVRCYARVLPRISDYTATGQPRSRKTPHYRLLTPNAAVAREAEVRASNNQGTSAEGSTQVPWVALACEKGDDKLQDGEQRGEEDVVVDQLVFYGNYQTLSVVVLGRALSDSTAAGSFHSNLRARPGRPAASSSFVDCLPLSEAPVASLASSVAPPGASGAASSAASAASSPLPVLLGLRAVPERRAVAAGARLNEMMRVAVLSPIHESLAAWLAEANAASSGPAEAIGEEKEGERRGADVASGEEDAKERDLWRKRKLEGQEAKRETELEGARKSGDGAACDGEGEVDVVMSNDEEPARQSQQENRGKWMEREKQTSGERRRDADPDSIDYASGARTPREGDDAREGDGHRAPNGDAAGDAAKEGVPASPETERRINDLPSSAPASDGKAKQDSGHDGGTLSSPALRSHAPGTRLGGDGEDDAFPAPPACVSVVIPPAAFWAEALQVVSRLFAGFVSVPDVPLASAFSAALAAAAPFSPDVLLLLTASACGVLESLVLGPAAQEARRSILAKSYRTRRASLGARDSQARGAVGVATQARAKEELADEAAHAGAGSSEAAAATQHREKAETSFGDVIQEGCAGGDAVHTALQLLGLEAMVRQAWGEWRAREQEQTGARRARERPSREAGAGGDETAQQGNARGESSPAEAHRVERSGKEEQARGESAQKEKGEDDGAEDETPPSSVRRVFFSEKEESKEDSAAARAAPARSPSAPRPRSASQSSLFVSFSCTANSAASSSFGSGAAGLVATPSVLLLVLRLMRRLALLRETASLLVSEGAIELLVSILVEAPVLPALAPARGSAKANRQEAKTEPEGAAETRGGAEASAEDEREEDAWIAEKTKEAKTEKVAVRGWKVKVEALKCLLVLVSHVQGMERFLGWDQTEPRADALKSSSPPSAEALALEGAGAETREGEKDVTMQHEAREASDAATSEKRSLYCHFLQALVTQLSFSRYHLKRLVAVLLSRVKSYSLLTSLQQVTLSLVRAPPSAPRGPADEASPPAAATSAFLASLSFGLGSKSKDETSGGLVSGSSKASAGRLPLPASVLQGDGWVSLAAETVGRLNLQLLHQTLPASAIAASRDERVEVDLSWPLTPSHPWSAASLVVCSRPSLPLYLQAFMHSRFCIVSLAVLVQCLYARLGLVLCPSTADLRLLSSLRSLLLLLLRASNGPLFLASCPEATQALLFYVDACGQLLLSRVAHLPDPLNAQSHRLATSLNRHLLALASPVHQGPRHSIGLSAPPSWSAVPMEFLRALLAARRGGEELEAASGPQDYLRLLGPAEQGFSEALLPSKKEEEAGVMALHIAASTQLHLIALQLLEKLMETPLFAPRRRESVRPREKREASVEAAVDRACDETIAIDVADLQALERLTETPGGRQAVAAAFRLRHADILLVMLLAETAAALTGDLEEGEVAGDYSCLRFKGPSAELLVCFRSLVCLVWHLLSEDEHASFLLPCGPLILVALRPLALLVSQLREADPAPGAAQAPATPFGAGEQRHTGDAEGDASFGALQGNLGCRSFIQADTHCDIVTLLRGDRALRSRIASLYDALLPLYDPLDRSATSLPSLSSLFSSSPALPPPPSPRALVDAIRCAQPPCALRLLQAAAAAAGAAPAGGVKGSGAAPSVAVGAGAAAGAASTGPSGGAAGVASPAAMLGGIDGGQGVELIDVAWCSELKASAGARPSPALSAVPKKGKAAAEECDAKADRQRGEAAEADAWEIEGDRPPEEAPLSALFASRLLTLYVRRCPHVLLFAGPEEIEFFLSSEDRSLDVSLDRDSAGLNGGKQGDDGTQFASRLAIEDDGGEDVAAWGGERLDRDGLGPLERSGLSEANAEGETGAAGQAEAEESLFFHKQTLYKKVGLADGVPIHPGLGLFLLSPDGQKALVSCLARCVALLEPPMRNLATMAGWQLQGARMQAWLETRQRTLPLVRALLMLFYNVLHGLTRPGAEDEEEEAYQEAAGYRNLDLLQLLLLLTGRLFAMGEWVGGASWEAEARAVVAAASGVEARRRRGKGRRLQTAEDADVPASPDVSALSAEPAFCEHPLLPPHALLSSAGESDLSLFSSSAPSVACLLARTARWVAGAEAVGHGSACLQARLCLAWCCRLFFLWFQNFRESQAFLVKHLIRFGAASLPALQQGCLLLLTSLGSFSSILPAAPHSFHLLPSARRPPICGGGVTPQELATAAAEAKREREKKSAGGADPRSKKPANQLSATVAAMLPPGITLSARVFSLLEMCALDWTAPKTGDAEQSERDAEKTFGRRGTSRSVMAGAKQGKKLESDSLPLYFCCEIDLTEEIAAAVSSSSAFLGAAAVFGRLSMGDEGIVPMEDNESVSRAGKGRPGAEEEGEDVAEVYRLLKETLWGVAAGEDEKGDSAQDGEPEKNEVSSLRRWMREDEAIRVEELVVLVSIVSRAAVSSSSALHALGAHAAAQLAAHRFPVYSLLFECMDTLLDSVLQQFDVEEERHKRQARGELDEDGRADGAEDLEGDECGNGSLEEVFAFVPASGSLEASRCLCRLLLFIEHLVALQAKASSSALPELERLVSLPCTRLLQVCLTVLSSSSLLAAAASLSTGAQEPAGLAEQDTKRGNGQAEDRQEVTAGDTQGRGCVREVAQALLRCCIRLATNIVACYQRLVDSAREAVETSEASCAYLGAAPEPEQAEKAADVPNHLAVIRKIAEALCGLCNRPDAAGLGIHTLGLALGFLVTLGAHPFTMLTVIFDLPQHSTDALLLPLRGEAKTEATAVAAGANSALQLGALLGKIVERTRTAAQHPEARSSHLWLGLADRLLLLVELLLRHAAHPTAPLFALLQSDSLASVCPWEAFISEDQSAEGKQGALGEPGTEESIDDLDIYADLQPADGEPKPDSNESQVGAASSGSAPAGAKNGDLSQREDPRPALLRPLHSALETLLSQCQLFLAAQSSAFSSASRAPRRNAGPKAEEKGKQRKADEAQKRKQMLLLAQQAVVLLAKTEETERKICKLLEGSAFFPPAGSSALCPSLRQCLFWGGEEEAFLWDVVAHCDVGFNVSVRRANSLTDPLLPVPAAQPVRDNSLRLVLDAALAARALESSEDWWAAVSLEAIQCEVRSSSAAATGSSQATGETLAAGAPRAGEAGASAGEDDGKENKDLDVPQLPAWFSDPLARFHQSVSVPAPVDCFGVPAPPAPPGRGPAYGATAQGAFAAGASTAAATAGTGRGAHDGGTAATGDPFRSRTKASSRAPSKHVDDYEAAVPGGLTLQKKPPAIPPPPPPEASASVSPEVSPGGSEEATAKPPNAALAPPASAPPPAPGALGGPGLAAPVGAGAQSLAAAAAPAPPPSPLAEKGSETEAAQVLAQNSVPGSVCQQHHPGAVGDASVHAAALAQQVPGVAPHGVAQAGLGGMADQTMSAAAALPHLASSSQRPAGPLGGFPPQALAGSGQKQVPQLSASFPPLSPAGPQALGAAAADPGLAGRGAAGAAPQHAGAAPVGDGLLGSAFVRGPAGAPTAPPQAAQHGFAAQIPTALQRVPGQFPPAHQGGQPPIGSAGASLLGVAEPAGQCVHPGGIAAALPHSQIPPSLVGQRPTGAGMEFAGMEHVQQIAPTAYPHAQAAGGLPSSHARVAPPVAGGVYGRQPAQAVAAEDVRHVEPHRLPSGAQGYAGAAAAPRAVQQPAGGVEQGLDAVPGWKEFAADGLREDMDVTKLAQNPELLKDPRIKSRFMRLLSRHEQIKNLFRMLGLDV